VVEEVAKKLNVDLSEIVTIELASAAAQGDDREAKMLKRTQSRYFLPKVADNNQFGRSVLWANSKKVYTVRQLLTSFVDLHRTPTRSLIASFALSASSSREQDAMILLTNSNDDYEGFVQDGGTVLDLLKKYPSINISLGSFLEMMPKLRFRYYSIASCPLKHPDGARIIGMALRLKG
jgi:sulfite reductase alpha subunit-like flavoprotein